MSVRMVRAMVLGVAVGGCGPTDPSDRPNRPDVTDSDGVDSDSDPPPNSGTPGPTLEVDGVRVALPTAPDLLGGADAAQGGDAVFVAWVVERDDGNQLYVARSADAGRSFDAPMLLSPPREPVSSWPRGPRIAADAERVVVATEGWLAFDRSTADFSVSPAQGPLAFGPLLSRDADPPYSSYFHPIPALDPVSGGIWAAWVAAIDLSGDVFVVREGEDWAEEVPSLGQASPPCECCPAAFAFTPSGDAVLAWRGDYLRDIWVLRARPQGAFDRIERATHNNWEETSCPRDGPALAETADQTSHLIWTDASTGKMQAWSTRRPRDGAWSAPQLIAPDPDAVQGRPTVALAEGTVWVAFEGAYAEPHVVVKSTDDGASWSKPLWLEGPGGLLSRVRLVQLNEGVGAVGVGEDGGLWLVFL